MAKSGLWVYTHDGAAIFHPGYRLSALLLWFATRGNGTPIGGFSSHIAALFIGTYDGTEGQHIFDLCHATAVYCGILE